MSENLLSLQQAEAIKKMEDKFEPFPVPRELRERVSELVDRLNPARMPNEPGFTSPIFLNEHDEGCRKLVSIAQALEFVITELGSMFDFYHDKDRGDYLAIQSLYTVQYALEREIQRQMDFNELVHLVWKYDPGILKAVDELKSENQAVGGQS